MQRFKREGQLITTQLSADEVGLLSSLVGQLIELVSDGDEEFAAPSVDPGDDPFARWAREFAEPTHVQPPEDPALQRLFPTAYTDDAESARDFRRLTERDLRTTKVTEAREVLERLVETGQGAQPLRIPVAEFEAWLRTLTGIRLIVASRLGITDSASAEELAAVTAEDPRAFLASVYEWLGFAQETMIMAVDR